MNLPNWAREPLVHFLALGAVLYVALTWGGSPPDPTSRIISVGASEVQRIAESFTLQLGRSPTDAELDRAVDTYVREEVLYREALRLGLDEDDAVVRRRMVSKMDLSASLAAETAEPSDEVLRTFFDENAERYAAIGAERSTLTFDQRVFASEAAARVGLNRGAVTGDATSLPASLNSISMRELGARFGQDFAKALQGMEPGEDWQGPIESGFGWHLVKLNKREIHVPEFESLRPVLANDWRRAQIAERTQRAYELLRSAYRIDINR